MKNEYAALLAFCFLLFNQPFWAIRHSFSEHWSDSCTSPGKMPEAPCQFAGQTFEGHDKVLNETADFPVSFQHGRGLKLQNSRNLPFLEQEIHVS